jgi:hypothetical protein
VKELKNWLGKFSFDHADASIRNTDQYRPTKRANENSPLHDLNFSSNKKTTPTKSGWFSIKENQ